jgi:SAM domain (Sterile alpha motif)
MAQLREWLEARGLERYADALLAQDIELDILPELTDADLTAAGLPVGARKRLLQAIEGLRNLSEPAMQLVGPPPIVPKALVLWFPNERIPLLNGRQCQPIRHPMLR